MMSCGCGMTITKEALRIISGTRQEYMNLALRILDDDRPKWESDSRLRSPHATRAHDTIAAAWCFPCLPSLRHFEFPLDCER